MKNILKILLLFFVAIDVNANYDRHLSKQINSKIQFLHSLESSSNVTNAYSLLNEVTRVYSGIMSLQNNYPPRLTAALVLYNNFIRESNLPLELLIDFAISNSANPTPTNKNIINAQSDTPLNVIVAALTGATYNFAGFSGTLTGGTYVASSSIGTFTNSTVTQDLTNTATGTLVIPGGNFAGTFNDIELTASTVINASVTGTVSGDYFTGTDFTFGNISQGNFDVVFVTLPAGSVFDIVDGELGSTGTFTTTAPMYLYLTGSAAGNITNGNLTQIGSAAGEFNYLDTTIPGGALSNLSFTGVFANGTVLDANHFDAASATGTVADGTMITINKTLSTNTIGTLNIQDGTFAGGSIIGLVGVAGTLAGGTFSSTSNYDIASVNITSPCIEGDINGTDHFLPNPSLATIDNTNIIGTMSASNNSLNYVGDQIMIGDIFDTVGINDFITGNCP